MLAALIDLPRGAPVGFALFAHCFTCTKDLIAARRIARALSEAGWGVVRFDFTGLGQSGGDFSRTTFSSNVDDLIAAARFMRATYSAPRLLVGHSFGGAAALVAAPLLDDVAAVAVIGAPSDEAYALRHFDESRARLQAEGSAEVTLAGRPFVFERSFVDDLGSGGRVLAAVGGLKRALLVLHAPLDEEVGADHASRIFAAARHPKSFVSLDTADHLLTREEDALYAGAVIAAWARRYAGDSAPTDEKTGAGARARSIPGRRLAVEVEAGGARIVVDAGADEGGDGLGPSPTRLVEGALAACTAITARMYAARKGLALDAIEVEVTGAPGEDAHAVRRMRKSVTLEGALTQAEAARVLEIADKCPVRRMLTDGVAIESAPDATNRGLTQT